MAVIMQIAVWAENNLTKDCCTKTFSHEQDPLDSLKYKNLNHFPNFALYLKFFLLSFTFAFTPIAQTPKKLPCLSQGGM